MGIIAYLNYEGGRWALAAGEGSYVADDFDEAVAAAHRLLGPLGGATVYVGTGPGAKVTSLRIQATAAAPDAAPPPLAAPDSPAPAPAPDRPPPPPPRAEPAVVAASVPGAAAGDPVGADGDLRAEIVDLRSSYQKSRGAIANLGTLEQDIGLATLRLEANHTLSQLRSTGPGLSEEDLEPLSSYVATLGGGKKSELAVNSLDKAGQKVVRDVISSLSGLAAKGALALIVGLVALIFGASSELGTEAAVVLFGGSGIIVVLAIRESGKLAKFTEETVSESWAMAESVGSEAEAAMSAPREIEQRLWKRCAGAAPWRHTPLATRARRWAKAIVVLTIAAFILAGIGFAYGFYLAVTEKLDSGSEYGLTVLSLAATVVVG
jgi:hypothetical protein